MSFSHFFPIVYDIYLLTNQLDSVALHSNNVALTIMEAGHVELRCLPLFAGLLSVICYIIRSGQRASYLHNLILVIVEDKARVFAFA